MDSPSDGRNGHAGDDVSPDTQLSLQQAARILGITASAVRYAAERGTLSAGKVGSYWITTRAHVDTYRRDHLGQRGPKRGQTKTAEGP